MSTSSPYIYIHRWGCPHEEVVNGLGDRVDPNLVFNPRYTPIAEEAPYKCPVCTDPNGVHVYIATKVPRTRMTIENTNAASSTSDPALRPDALPFALPTAPAQAPSAVSGPSDTATTATSGPRLNAPTGPRAMGPHKLGHPCPEGVPECHFHHSDPKACHKPVPACDLAYKAIRSSFYAANRWTGAPVGWNEEHEACIRSEDAERCALHDRFQRDKERKV